MAIARPGDPALDRDVVQKFVDVYGQLVAHVDLLGSNDVIRNLGVDALDDIEMSLRQIRLEADRARIAFAKHRTVRTRQGMGGAVGSLTARVAELEKLGSVAMRPWAEPAEGEAAPIAVNEVIDGGVEHDQSPAATEIAGSESFGDEAGT